MELQRTPENIVMIIIQKQNTVLKAIQKIHLILIYWEHTFLY